MRFISVPGRELSLTMSGIILFEKDNGWFEKQASSHKEERELERSWPESFNLDKYSFLVSPKANKFQIAQAVNELYGVKPISVNIGHIPGKVVRFGRSMGRRSDYKKAIVTLEKGKTIVLHENV